MAPPWKVTLPDVVPEPLPMKNVDDESRGVACTVPPVTVTVPQRPWAPEPMQAAYRVPDSAVMRPPEISTVMSVSMKSEASPAPIPAP